VAQKSVRKTLIPDRGRKLVQRAGGEDALHKQSERP